MKKLIPIIAAVVLSLSAQQSQAQAFDKDTKILSIGIGGADMFHIPVGYYSYRPSFYQPITGEIFFQGEFAVHRYVGVGFTTAIGGRGGSVTPLGGVGPLGGYGGYYPEFNIAVGAIANFHFYQLIADKVKKNIHADKLDVYAGLSLGTGIAIHPGGYYDGNNNYRNGAFNDVLFFIGPQVGARYYFTPKIAANLELGYGKNFVNAGITFKIGGKK